jgi:cysteine desulfurase/selenocysteine lyase
VNTFVQDIRKSFPIFRSDHHQNLVYLDNASTTQKPDSVLNSIKQFYKEINANVHRGLYTLGQKSTEAYEGARQEIANFISADDSSSIIFTKGTTEAINLVASAWGDVNLNEGEEILISEMEHHSNIVPWQLLAKRKKAVLKAIPLTDDHKLDLDSMDSLLTGRTRIVALAHQSNVTGIVNPIKAISKKLQNTNAVLLIDGAQSIAHLPIDVNNLGCDFFAFSGHKMYGPTGVGVLYTRKNVLDEMEPYQGGGEMIDRVTIQESTWNDPPWKFEAGTPNIAQAVGLGAAVEFLSEIGLNIIENRLIQLTQFALEEMNKISGIHLFHSGNPSENVISFIIEGIHPQDLAMFMNEDEIAFRVGHHCAQPLMKHFRVPATARISFAVYNSHEDIKRFIQSLKNTVEILKRHSNEESELETKPIPEIVL